MMQKYVTYEDGSCDVFNQVFQHSLMAAKRELKPVSAGFFIESDGCLMVFGRSGSLNLGQLPNDDEKIKKALGKEYLHTITR